MIFAGTLLSTTISGSMPPPSKTDRLLSVLNSVFNESAISPLFTIFLYKMVFPNYKHLNTISNNPIYKLSAQKRSFITKWVYENGSFMFHLTSHFYFFILYFNENGWLTWLKLSFQVL